LPACSTRRRAPGALWARSPWGATNAACRRSPPSLIYALNVPLLGALALVHQAALALLVLACSTVTMTVGDLIFAVYVQRQVPAAEQGRAFGLLFWFFAVGQLTGAMLGVGVSSAGAVPALLRVSLAVLPLILAGLLLYLRSMGAATARAGAEATATVA